MIDAYGRPEKEGYYWMHWNGDPWEMVYVDELLIGVYLTGACTPLNKGMVMQSRFVGPLKPPKGKK